MQRFIHKNNFQQYYLLPNRSRMYSFIESYDDDNEDFETELKMENLYMQWNLEDDKILYENRREPLSRLASLLGRGLKGVEARQSKLKDTDSAAYRRLFITSKEGEPIDDYNDVGKVDMKLKPVIDVLQRIRWDPMLLPGDFHVLYYDRLEDDVIETPFNSPNVNVKGREEMFVFAIPEHRIMAIKYKERVVWDKERRLDNIFGSMNGNGVTIDIVIENYSEWKREKEKIEEYNRKRQMEITRMIKRMLGDDRFGELKKLSAELKEKSKPWTLNDADINKYVENTLNLFRLAAEGIQSNDDTGKADDKINDDLSMVKNTNVSISTKKRDMQSLETLSNLVSLILEEKLREKVLSSIEKNMKTMEDKGFIDTSKKVAIGKLPELLEKELSEKFVKGSGSGGQKINKTSNKVVLLHKPTKIKVDCQDTRSLSQNRKIARKKLQLKLDEYYNGSQSKVKLKAVAASNKKAKQKARRKAKLKKKKGVEKLKNEDTV